MAKKILIILGSLVVVIAGIAAVSAFEAWVINVTATIENALRVHSRTYDFGTVFPQEYFDDFTFTVGTSDSFSDRDQDRVLNIDYVIKQKPKPRDPVNAEYCHENSPSDPGDPNDPYYDLCYPNFCSALSKTPAYGEPPEHGVPSFHDPDDYAQGSLHKYSNLDDIWILDLDVPCFKGECAQDWDHPGFELPAGLDGQEFGCDLWVEVTKIY